MGGGALESLCRRPNAHIKWRRGEGQMGGDRVRMRLCRSSADA